MRIFCWHDCLVTFLTVILSAGAIGAVPGIGIDQNVFDLPLAELMSLEVKTEIASFFPEEELVVGSSVSVMTADDMRRLGARRLKGVLENELSVIETHNMGGAYITSIRGYSKTTAGGVAMMVDGIHLSSLSQTNPFLHVPEWIPGMLDRVEMIKGPGSAIYGAEAFQGVISLKTFESDNDLFYVDGTLASSAYGSGTIKISQGVVDNLVRIDMAVGLTDQGDQDLAYTYHDTTISGRVPVMGTGERKHVYDCENGVVKLRYEPESGVKARLAYYGNNFDSDRFPGGGYNTSNFSMREYDYSYHDADMDMFSGRLSYQLANGIILSADAYYWRNELEGQYTLYDLPEPLDIFTFDVNQRSSATLMAKQSENDLNIKWMIAGTVTQEKIPDGDISVRGINSGVFYRNYDRTPYENFSRNINSALGQIKWAFVKDRAYLLAGGRLDAYDDMGDQFSPRLGLIYKPTPASAVKALYGHAFNAPSAYNIYGQNVSIKGNLDIKPETIDVYELIYLYRDNDWKLGLTGFYSYWQDGIVFSPYDDPAYPDHHALYINSGENRSYGVEGTCFHRLGDFAFNLGLSWVKSEALNFEDPFQPGRMIDTDYDAFPTYSVLLGLYYTLKCWEIDIFLNNRVYVDRKVYSIPDIRVVEVGVAEDLDTYWRTDLNISKALPNGCRADLNIRNLFDRDNHVPSVMCVESGVAEPGITAMLKVSYSL